MPTVQELVTKFSFDVDRSGIQKFQNTLTGVKRTILSVGTALGVGLGTKAMVRFGTETEEATFQAGRFNKIIKETGEFAAPLQNRLNKLNDMLGGSAFTDPEAFNAFTEFSNVAEGFPSIEGKFDEFFEFATLISKAGQLNDIAGTFSNLMNTIKTGDPGILADLPGITDIDVAKLQKMNDLLQGAFFLSPDQRPLAAKRILNLFSGVRSELQATAVAASQTGSGELDKAKTELEKAAQNLGERLLGFLTPAIKGITELLKLVQGDGTTFPILESLGRALGLIPDKAKQGEESIDSLVASLKTLGVSAGAGIVAGLVFGLPPLLGAAIGMSVGFGAIKLSETLNNTEEEPRTQAQADAANEELRKMAKEHGVILEEADLFKPTTPALTPAPPSVPTTPALTPAPPSVPTTPAAPTSAPPLVGANNSRGNTTIHINVTGANPQEIAREVARRVSEVVGSAQREFTALEGVPGIG